VINKRPDKRDYSELRTTTRISVTRKGVLTAGHDALALTSMEERFTCLIQDMSPSGFLLLCTEPFLAGQVLDFSCELFPEQVLECKVEVVHVGESVVGAKIVEIDDRGIELCQLFLREEFSARRQKSIGPVSKAPARGKTGNPSTIARDKASRGWFLKKRSR